MIFTVQKGLVSQKCKVSIIGDDNKSYTKEILDLFDIEDFEISYADYLILIEDLTCYIDEFNNGLTNIAPCDKLVLKVNNKEFINF